MIKNLLFIFVFFPLIASASEFCKEVDKTAILQGTRFNNSDNLYKVDKRGRLQFYSAPDIKCIMKGVFVIPDDDLYVYLEYEDFYRVMYLTGDGGQETGWVDKNRLIETKKGMAPNYFENQ